MPARKIRVELFDSDGNRYTVSFEGQLNREKAVRLLDLVELLGGMPAGEEHTAEKRADLQDNEISKYDRVRRLVQRNFPLAWFSSKEVRESYEQEVKEPIGLSTVATYLSRLANNGILTRTGPPNSLKYRLAQGYPSVQVKEVSR
jgi:hypothetical protein